MPRINVPNLYGSYKGINNFIKSQFYQNPAYSLGEACTIQEEYRQFIQLWYAWYSGYVDEFHAYHIYNGSESVKVDRNSLEMAKKLCEDKADMLLNERVEITLEDAGAQAFLDDVLRVNKFRSRANELIEKTNALGTGAFVEFVDKDKVCIDYVTTEKVMPLSIVNGEVVSCAFASVTTHENKDLIYINSHVRLYPIDNTPENAIALAARQERGIPAGYDGYMIENFKLEGKGTNVHEIETDMVDYVLTDSTVPFFQIIKPAKANNLCVNDLGLGLSVFSNALGQLQSTDRVYDSYVNEFILGRKRLFIHDDLAQVEVEVENGENIFKPKFDPNDTVFYSLDLGEGNDKIKSEDPELRIEAHEMGLNRMLNLLGFKCGFGNNYYKFEGGVIKTATEVISENNPLYKSIKKDQHILREALIGMSRAILILGGLIGSSFKEDQDITVDFDDSIFEDKAATKKEALLEFSSGLIDRIEYFVKVYGLTTEQATKKVAEMDKRTPKESNIDDMGGGA